MLRTRVAFGPPVGITGCSSDPEAGMDDDVERAVVRLSAGDGSALALTASCRFQRRMSSQDHRSLEVTRILCDIGELMKRLR